MPQTQQYITPKQLICYLDRMAGVPTEEIATSLQLTEGTVSEYSKRVNAVVKNSSRSLERFQQVALSLVPLALKRVHELLPQASMTDAMRYLEGTQTLNKHLMIQHNIVHASLDELMAIVRQQADGEDQYAEVIEVIDDTENIRNSDMGTNVQVGETGEGSTPNQAEYPYSSQRGEQVCPSPENNSLSGLSTVDVTPVESRPPKKYWSNHRYEIDGIRYRCDGSEWNEGRGDWDYRLVEIRRKGRRAGRRYLRKRRPKPLPESEHGGRDET